MTTFLKPGVSPDPNEVVYTTEMPGRGRWGQTWPSNDRQT